MSEQPKIVRLEFWSLNAWLLFEHWCLEIDHFIFLNQSHLTERFSCRNHGVDILLRINHKIDDDGLG